MIGTSMASASPRQVQSLRKGRISGDFSASRRPLFPGPIRRRLESTSFRFSAPKLCGCVHEPRGIDRLCHKFERGIENMGLAKELSGRGNGPDAPLKRYTLAAVTHGCDRRSYGGVMTIVSSDTQSFPKAAVPSQSFPFFPFLTTAHATARGHSSYFGVRHLSKV